MKYLIALILLFGIIMSPIFAVESNNPSLIINTIEIPSYEFNKILRDADIIQMERPHSISWQVTIDNNLLYANPDGNAVLRLYDKENPEKFVEIGMGAKPNEKFWIAVQTPKEGYIIVHEDL